MSKVTTTLDKQKWMSKVLDIDQLKLTDIVWPGAHNSGMDKKASNYDVLSGNWTTCQNDSFAWQLENGARAFDIRLGFTPGLERPTFYFHHNGYQSHRTLDELVEAVSAFLDRNPDEFIVLDFHQLGDGNKPFDRKLLSELLLVRLGSRLIPFSHSTSTIAELKGSSSKRRIIMAAGYSSEQDNNYFWPQITHKWNRKVFTDTITLERHIQATLEDAPYDTFIWSLPATCYSLLGGPADIKRYINAWFHSSRDWVTRCSIISTDFFDESEIVHYCWVACSMKAVYGRALHESD
ncbi:phospholipase [Pseudomonas sp. McL0111]|uniref:phospholipase n=1 Tax=Pseudomonas sp. McL0111 TaxID=3457357 RepID=UPI00403E5D44